MKAKMEETHPIMGARAPKRRREVHDLVVAILTFAKTGRRKTHIISRIGLSHSQSKKYLECLKESGFMAEKSGIWKTTRKGANVIEACQLCRELAHQVYE